MRPRLIRFVTLFIFALWVSDSPLRGLAQETKAANASASAKVADLAFLAGAWRYQAGADTFEEVWFAPVGEVMTGMGRHTRGDKHASHEFLRIALIDGAIQYEAQPSGQKLTLFKLTKLENQQAVFENPAHDFPTTVSYQRSGDTLTAKIEGKRGERVVAIEFKFKKTDLAKEPAKE
jgi:hypothetical protein